MVQRVLAVGIVGLLFGGGLMAEDNAALKLEVERLKLELERLETEKKIATAKGPADPGAEALAAAKLQADLAEQRRKAQTNSLPSTEAKALEGSTKADDKAGGMETATLAYASAEAVAAEVAKRLKGMSGVERVVVHSEADAGAVRQYGLFLAQAGLLKQGYASVKETAEAARVGPESLEPVTAQLKSLIDLVALFRSDIELKGRDVTIDPDALVAALGKQLANSSIALYHPKLYPGVGADVTQSPAFKTLSDLEESRRSAELAVRQAAGQKILPEAAQAELKARLERLVNVHDALVTQLTKAEPAAGPAPLAALLQVDALRKEHTYVLVLKPVAAGGTVRVTRNLWTFFGAPRVAYSGAAIVSMMLFDREGRLVLSDALYQHSGFTRFKVPQRFSGDGKSF